jgi:hypothetical protein
MTDLWPARRIRVSSRTAGFIHSQHVPLDDAIPQYSSHRDHATSRRYDRHAS